MGLFRKLGKAIEAVVDLTDDSGHGVGSIDDDRPPVALGANASSLAELRALHSESGGRAGRAIVQRTDGVSEVAWGESGGGHEAVLMVLRVRELDGGFGPTVEKRVVMPRAAGLQIGAGLEVPVERDPNSGELVGVDRDALIEQLRPQFDEALAAERARRDVSVASAATAIRDGFTDMRAADAAAAPSETLEGVTADQWLQARRVLAKGRIPDAVRDRTLAAYGIAPATWPAVDAAWSNRAITEPLLAERLANL